MTRISSKLLSVSVLSGFCTYLLIKTWEEHTDSPSLFLKAISLFPIIVGYFTPSEEIGLVLVNIAAFLQFFVIFTVLRLVSRELIKNVFKRSAKTPEKQDDV